MSDDRNPIEQAVDQALDAFVYAPIGLVFEGPALYPELVQKGRNQVRAARMIGEMAVNMGQTEAGKRLAGVDGPLRDVLAAMGVVAPTGPPPGAQPEPTVASTIPTASSAPAAGTGRARRPAKKTTGRPAKKTTRRPVKKSSGSTAPTKGVGAAKPAADAPDPSSLGISDYDSLSASQVVKRLRGMDAPDLEAVKAYEAATRARKTILNRITQIQKS